MPSRAEGNAYAELADDAKRKLREKALRLRNAGMSYTDAALETGIPYSRIKDEIVLAMRELADEPISHTAMGQISTLRDIRRALYSRVLRGDEVAIDRILKVMDHEAKLLGLYAPARVQAVIGGGVSDAEFAVVAEAMLRQAGREIPRHIAAAAQAARAAGILPPAQIVVDGAAS